MARPGVRYHHAVDVADGSAFLNVREDPETATGEVRNRILFAVLNAPYRRRGVGLLALILFLAAGSGCATGGNIFARPPFEFLPYNSPLRTRTLAEPDAWLRHHMMFGRPDSALHLLEGRNSAAPDELLRAVQQAIVLREAGDHAGSNELLEWAEREAEQRSVRSITRTAGSFLINDRALSWVPAAGEFAMIPFYRMLNYAESGDWTAAAVEARRMTTLLGREDRGSVRACASDAMLQYVSGLVFEAAGELNDALVALRRAEASYSICGAEGVVSQPAGLGADLYRVARALGVAEVADSARVRYGLERRSSDPEAGEILIILERGFIGHLTEEVIDIPIVVEEIDSLKADDQERLATVGAAIAARLALDYGEHGVWGRGYGAGRYRGRRDIDLDDIYVLRLAWPALRRDPPPAKAWLIVDGDTLGLYPSADLSVVAEEDLQARRTGMLARLVTRGILKYLLVHEAEEKAEEEGGRLAGTVTGLLANAVANNLERADTRSWTLLPDEIVVARVTVPAGRHELSLQVSDGVGDQTRVTLDRVEVRRGRLTIVHRRLWSDDPSTWTGAAPSSE